MHHNNRISSVHSIYIAILVSVMWLLSGCEKPSDLNENDGFYVMDFEKSHVTLQEFETVFFTTFPHQDPTEGNVIYDRVKWTNTDMLVSKPNDAMYMFIRSSKDPSMYDSTRLTSKHMYNVENDKEALLFVFKGRLPSANGIWPAWWLNGSYENEWLQSPSSTDSDLDAFSGQGNFYDTSTAVNGTDWPSAGEVDIIETINGHKTVHNTLHTCPQMYNSTWNDNPAIVNCANANASDPNPGCSGSSYDVLDTEGTFAAIWKKSGLTFFFWPSGSDVRSFGGPLSDKPTPTLWENQLKNTVQLMPSQQECNAELHQSWQCKNCQNSHTKELANLKMIFNITLCGKWAGEKFDETEQSLANCQAHIRGDGKQSIDGEYIQIDYLSVQKLTN